jgi:hypothetical protein
MGRYRGLPHRCFSNKIATNGLFSRRGGPTCPPLAENAHSGTALRLCTLPLPTRSQVALGNEATRPPSSIIIFRERDNTRPVGVPGRTGLAGAAGVEAVAGACLAGLIPEIAALPDAVAHTGEWADDGGVVSQHSLRVMAGSARPTLSVKHRRDACATGQFRKGDPPGRPYANHVLAVQEAGAAGPDSPFPLWGMGGDLGDLVPPALPQVTTPSTP